MSLVILVHFIAKGTEVQRVRCDGPRLVTGKGNCSFSASKPLPCQAASQARGVCYMLGNSIAGGREDGNEHVLVRMG